MRHIALKRKEVKGSNNGYSFKQEAKYEKDNCSNEHDTGWFLQP